MSEIGLDRPSPVADVDPIPSAALPRRSPRRRLLVAVIVAALVLVAGAGGVAFTLMRRQSSQPVPVTAGRSHEVDLHTLMISSVPLAGAQQSVTPGCPDRMFDAVDASQLYGGADEVRQTLVGLGYRRGYIRCWTSGGTTTGVILLQFDTDIGAANFGTDVRTAVPDNIHFTVHEVSGIPGAASMTRDVDPADAQRLTAIAVGHRGDILVQAECICPEPVRPTTVEQLLRAQLLRL
jgi:hypothetical protein